MAALLLEGWLVKDGNMLGSWKNRYCVLTFANGAFSLDYYVSDDKSDKKGTFVLARDSGFTKVANSGDIKNCFSLSVAASGSGSRKTGSKVTFSAPSMEAFVLWEKAFKEAKAPVGIMPGVGKSFGKPELIVLGASGYIGVATVNSLTAYSKDYNIKAGVRDVSSAKNSALVGGGVKLVQADMNKPKSLEPAVNGAKCVFIVVPGTQDRATLAINALNACKAVGVQHIVLLSVTSAVRAGTIFAEQFLPVESVAEKLGVPYTIVRVPMFMENILGQMQSIAISGEFYTPLEAPFVQNCASVGDIGEAVAKIMASPEKYVNKTLNLTGNAVAEKDFAEAFTKVMGSRVKHVGISYLDAKASMLGMGVPEWQADGIIETYKMCTDKEPAMIAGTSDLHTILQRGLATPASLAAYAAPGLKAIKAAAEYEAKVAAEEAAAKMESMKLVAAEAQAAIDAAEAAAKAKAQAEAIAKHVQQTRLMINNGGLVLKKMGNETGYKNRFVWIDDDDKKLCWSKTETKEAQFKSIDLIQSVKVSQPEFSAAKSSSVFGVAEPDGFCFSVSEADGKPSLDLKIEGTVEDAFAWINSIKVLCGHIAPAKRGSIIAVDAVVTA
eukprot:CAMPEP_0174967610 /NCGR_PEP_ID=MMETSP0004_2-20121128/7678_1 /TAXON_ID=420556 /ORGANISM="Ochromonas sp., Strain CCMP1393" /LENGTH=609 /DNA_ID=CAMNT_0016216759 /DNA_START=77 /DNA_END=1906 /DNA_ORIENTATION=+